jgi:hypothetical protein
VQKVLHLVLRLVLLPAPLRLVARRPLEPHLRQVLRRSPTRSEEGHKPHLQRLRNRQRA